MGSASDETLTPGAHPWFPILYGIANVDVQIQKSDVETTAATKDMQDLHAEIAVNWAMNPDLVVNTYKTIGDERDVLARIITPAVNEVLKTASSQRTAEEVLAKRMELKKDIDDGLMKRLAQYGIKLYDVSVVHLKFSESFEKAIEEKQVAEQQAQQAVYVAQKATQDAKAAVEQAKGQAESQKLIKATISGEVLQKLALEKWNGVLPTYMGGSNIPMLNLGK